MCGLLSGADSSLACRCLGSRQLGVGRDQSWYRHFIPLLRGGTEENRETFHLVYLAYGPGFEPVTYCTRNCSAVCWQFCESRTQRGVCGASFNKPVNFQVSSLGVLTYGRRVGGFFRIAVPKTVKEYRSNLVLCAVGKCQAHVVFRYRREGSTKAGLHNPGSQTSAASEFFLQ